MSSPQPAAGIVLDLQAAFQLVARHAASLTPVTETEFLPLLEARGRVLAEPVHADRNQPPFPRSARDGFAVNAAEFTAGKRLLILGEVRAGGSWTGSRLALGQAVRIMTGAPVPAGVDAVAMVEHVETDASTVCASPGRSLAAGENIVPEGSEARAGDVVLAAGQVLGPAALALAASCGSSRLRVFRKPRVAIVATGDELVELDQVPRTEQIRNSNSYALAALVAAAGGEPVRLPIAPDERAATEAALAEARKADLIVVSGGVSMGEYDLVEDALSAAGGSFLFTGVRMQPGRPAVFGRLPATADDGAPCYFFGLPGNPISVQVTFHCFAEPLLRALAGAGTVAPRWALARLAAAVPARAGVTRLLPARQTDIEVQVVGWQGSGDLTANAQGTCYVELLPGQAYAAGEIVRILLR